MQKDLHITKFRYIFAKSNQTKIMYYKIINAKLEELNISVYKLSKDCQIPYSTLQTNLSGKCEFSIKNLKKVCAYLGIEL